MTILDYAKMEARARRDFERGRRRMAKKANTSVVVSVGFALDLLFDPRIGRGVAELMAVCFGAATGKNKNRRECFGCLQPWSLNRAVVGIVLVEFLDGSNEALLCGLCQDCHGRDAVVIDACKRDLTTEVQHIHRHAGHA